jgi:RND family efflux transporter MFP subunit
MRSKLVESTCIALLAVLIVASCAEAPVSEQGSVARPVKTALIGGPASASIRKFPGRVESAKRADLAFRAGGTIAALRVQEGNTVTQNQVLARLDQADVEIALAERQAKWDQANKDYARSQELVAEGAISRRDFDQVEANYKTADAALKQANLNLEQTELRAPFDGQIAQRHVENFEEVGPGQRIYSIIDQSSLEIEIDVPENIILLLPKPQETEDGRQRVNAWASFDADSNRQFPLQFKEAATRADAQTQTFAVTFSLTAPNEVTVLPGMTANVTVDAPAMSGERSVYNVPLSAVTGDPELSPRVWIVDENSMTVHGRAVQVGRMTGNAIELVAGIEPGLRIVTAGAAFLDEGMAVSILPQTEQATTLDQSPAR